MIDAVASGRTILVPNAELASALLDWVERRLDAGGRGVWPTPRVREFNSWLRELHQQRLLLDSTLPRMLSDTEVRELWRSVLLEDDSAHHFLEPSGAARAARQARAARLDHSIPKSAIAEFADEETEAYLRWDEHFEQRCRELRCVAPDQALEGFVPAEAHLAWIEHAAWRPAARRWLSRHAGAALAAPCVEKSCVRHVHASSAEGEVAAAAAWAAERSRADPGFRAWICVPDLVQRRASVIDAFDAVLAPQRYALREDAGAAPYAVAGGTPLARYAPVRALLEVLQATLGDLSFEAVSALLLMPALQRDEADELAAIRIEVELRRRGPAEAPLRQWLLLTEQSAARLGLPPPHAAECVRSALEATEERRGPEIMSRWVQMWMTVARLAPWQATERWSSADYQSAMRMRELMGALAEADRTFGRVSRRTAHTILSRAAEETPFQPQTGIPPIWISSQMMDPWLTYDGLWVMRCAAEAWPPAVQPVPLLPIGLQRRYGITSAAAATQLEFARDLQRSWLARGRECVFSCADPGDGQATLSAILPLPTWVPSVAGALEAATCRPHWAAQHDRRPALESLEESRGPAFGQDERTHGVATLRAQSRCAFWGFAETRLAAAALEKPVPGFNDMERGTLVHSALEAVWQALGASSALQALDAERRAALIDAAAVQAIERQRARRDPGPRYCARERIRLRHLLNRWLDAEAKRAAFSVEQIEGAVYHATHAGLRFDVRIDRIDRLDDGARVLIDYKTGASHPDWRGERPMNPQLPMYALCEPTDLIAVAYGRVNAGECKFVAESGRNGIFSQKGQAARLEGQPNFAALIAVWSDRIEALARDVALGNAVVAPLPHACRHCRLQALCRVKSALDEDQDVLDE